LEKPYLKKKKSTTKKGWWSGLRCTHSNNAKKKNKSPNNYSTHTQKRVGGMIELVVCLAQQAQEDEFQTQYHEDGWMYG
jgi:hypothetical protein